MNNKVFRRITIVGAAVIVACSIIAAAACGWTGCVISLLTGILTLAVFVCYTGKRYKDIEDINNYLSKILAGKYDLDIQKNEEGELSILQNNIYKSTVLLREKNEQLLREKSYLGEMLTDISHQLKTPLTSVMMMNELLQKEESEEKRKEFLTIEEKQLEKMNWLISTLLKLSKLDAGTVRLKEEEVSLSALIDDSLSPFLVQMELKGISIQKEITDTLITLDINWTVEALRNIIKNCIEHMDSGGMLGIKNTENTLFHSVFITDTGSGISEEDLPHIFERFYKSKASSAEGTGIGLSLSRTVVEKQRGCIKVVSALNHGSCFEVRFYKSVI